MDRPRPLLLPPPHHAAARGQRRLLEPPRARLPAWPRGLAGGRSSAHLLPLQRLRPGPPGSAQQVPGPGSAHPPGPAPRPARPLRRLRPPPRGARARRAAALALRPRRPARGPGAGAAYASPLPARPGRRRGDGRRRASQPVRAGRGERVRRVAGDARRRPRRGRRPLDLRRGRMDGGAGPALGLPGGARPRRAPPARLARGRRRPSLGMPAWLCRATAPQYA